jgi:hypothetical protein
MKADLLDFMMGERLNGSKSPKRNLADTNQDISDFMDHEDQLSSQNQSIGQNLISITNMNQKVIEAVQEEAKGYQRLRNGPTIIQAIDNNKKNRSQLHKVETFGLLDSEPRKITDFHPVNNLPFTSRAAPIDGKSLERKINTNHISRQNLNLPSNPVGTFGRSIDETWDLEPNCPVIRDTISDYVNILGQKIEEETLKTKNLKKIKKNENDKFKGAWMSPEGAGFNSDEIGIEMHTQSIDRFTIPEHIGGSKIKEDSEMKWHETSQDFKEMRNNPITTKFSYNNSIKSNLECLDQGIQKS